MAGTRAAEAGVHALLSDGETVLIRSALPGDHEGLLRLYDDMSAENRRLRFFGAGRRPGHEAADWMLAPPRRGHRALVAVHGDRIIGIAEYEVTSGRTVAEISSAVADDFHQRGVGTLLVEHLGDAARQAGRHHRLHGRHTCLQPPDAAPHRRPRPGRPVPARGRRSAHHHRPDT
ncbi:GNAT family N-acetyltransferase [Actinacidiphila bryophytorum]|nr:GNAT family N-acetyltransferase [Actinacidiphila bryophytorum]MBN6542313.1 GNAT family N-acetyltransferase [Actinacidiphila bryophytorum]